MRTLVFLLLLLVTNNVLAMAKTLIWECQVIKVNNDKQINGKVNKYKIDVTTPMVWVGDETRWSGFANTTFSYDRDDHSLFSSSKMWNGVYDLIERKIIFINNDANLKVLYQCEEL
tara:strand:- start:2667 stop:3014 length:348 start_codon:yes stop_codon:yes gene_type:complete